MAKTTKRDTVTGNVDAVSGDANAAGRGGDAPMIEAAGVRLVTRPLIDRLGHRIEIELGDRFAAVLETVDDAPDASDDWPPSPPLQDWHIEERPDGARILLAVGAAGKTHWSASIELGRDAAAQFDVAARVAGPPGFLGTHYRLLRPGAKQIALDRLDVGGGWRLTCDAATSGIRLDEPTGTAIIKPISAAAHTWPQTIRWRYRIENTAFPCDQIRRDGR